jgi:mRNA interferase MazF
MTTAAYNDTNPFAVKFKAPGGVTSYILGHQPKSFDWRAKNAKPRRLRKVGHSGYVALFEIEDDHTVTVTAIRHQREEDYH